MQYIIRRTSESDDTKKPCPGCQLKQYIRIDERCLDDPSKNPLLHAWYDTGDNHRVEDGHIKRDFKDTAWFLEIKTLIDINAFVKKYGDCVIQKYHGNPEIMEIEIYDDYRE